MKSPEVIFLDIRLYSFFEFFDASIVTDINIAVFKYLKESLNSNVINRSSFMAPILEESLVNKAIAVFRVSYENFINRMHNNKSLGTHG